VEEEEKERIADDNDRASKLEIEFTENALIEVRLRCVRQQEPDSEGRYLVTECEDCGETIPIARLRVAIYNKKCVVCQERFERLRKLRLG
jgi:RNA polymerase-binding transcription factor DksA